MIDRIAPSRRPKGRATGYQQWRSLLFMHWAIPVDDLRRLVPAKLALDLFDGTAYVGIVPFEMQGIRPSWCPKTFAFNFLETNLRTYVLWNDRPGVYFFSLEASSWIAVLAARSGWGLPYHYAQMKMSQTGNEIHYDSRRTGNGAMHRVHYQRGAELGPSEPGTLQHFFLERYLLFVERNAQILTGQVHHTPYPVKQARVLSIHDELISAAGLPAVREFPAFVHYSPGVDVEVFQLHAESVSP